jgi:hypothetical protein
MNKELERIGRGLLEVVSGHMPGNAVERQENNQENCSPGRNQNQISRIQNRTIIDLSVC